MIPDIYYNLMCGEWNLKKNDMRNEAQIFTFFWDMFV